MNQVGGWRSYTGSDVVILVIILLVIAIVFAFLGIRLRRPIEPKTPGKYVGASLALIWILAWLSFFTAAITYYQALIQQIGPYTSPQNPISPVTMISALATFLIVAYLSRRGGWITSN